MWIIHGSSLDKYFHKSDIYSTGEILLENSFKRLWKAYISQDWVKKLMKNNLKLEKNKPLDNMLNRCKL